MPLDQFDAGRVWDMLRYARITAELVEGRRKRELQRDIQFRLALERAIEIIGEAARRITRETEQEFPEIPWQKIVQQRHVIAHDYADLDYNILWRVATVHIPALIPQLEAILPEPPEDPLPETSDRTPD